MSAGAVVPVSSQQPDTNRKEDVDLDEEPFPPRHHQLMERRDDWRQLFESVPLIGSSSSSASAQCLLPELIEIIIEYCLSYDHLSTSVLERKPKPQYDLPDLYFPEHSGVLKYRKKGVVSPHFQTRRFVLYEYCLDWYQLKPKPGVPFVAGRILSSDLVAVSARTGGGGTGTGPEERGCFQLRYRTEFSDKPRALILMAGDNSSRDAWVKAIDAVRLQHTKTKNQSLVPVPVIG